MEIEVPVPGDPTVATGVRHHQNSKGSNGPGSRHFLIFLVPPRVKSVRLRQKRPKKTMSFFWAILVVNERFLFEVEPKKSKNVVSLDHFLV